MRNGIEVRLRPGDRERLEAVISDRKSPQHHLWRARIVLMTADGAGTMAIRATTGKGKPTIWRWQERYAREGADGLFRDAPRGRAFSAALPEQVAAVVERTLHERPPVATHWTLRSMAKASGFAPSLQHGFGHHLDGQHGDGMGLETTVDQALIRGLDTARP